MNDQFPMCGQRLDRHLKEIEEDAAARSKDFALVLALLQIARQLARLADAYEEVHK